MTAIETVRRLMSDTGTTLTDLCEYSDLGSKSNICQMLSRGDLKVEVFCKLLETMGFRLVVQSDETDQTINVMY